MANVNLETDFARIAVESKGHRNQEDLLEHALHMLMAEYRERYGLDATQFVLNKLEGYYGR